MLSFGKSGHIRIYRLMYIAVATSIATYAHIHAYYMYVCTIRMYICT